MYSKKFREDDRCITIPDWSRLGQNRYGTNLSSQNFPFQNVLHLHLYITSLTYIQPLGVNFSIDTTKKSSKQCSLKNVLNSSVTFISAKEFESENLFHTCSAASSLVTSPSFQPLRCAVLLYWQRSDSVFTPHFRTSLLTGTLHGLWKILAGTPINED